ncbi:LacI family DNA-binding transcriptional regulator [Hymenobacter properus]|uniref:Substrate-binding domain-containing protein n=1 Tax=Hymenobacter properus TaxID=2791026 RepID=A0A931FIC6_9BACT|nr:substrate-binding domain-containing protein [Hymenobacter properus]MBF9141912.1 substrate-binding domain-containing protein [Hymenobacter properus]MBR7720720.1 substrate-binding domain-containing protein [Microvirga sp. SRT04]
MSEKVKKRTLISDIAAHLEVSIATVSLVLNGKAKQSRISDAVAERVLAYVKEVGYKPNHLAKSLRTGKTHVIGLVVEDIANPFFATVAALIERQAFERGYRIIYCSTNNDTARAQELISMFQERHVDGYIVVPAADIEQQLTEILREHTPTVLFDRYLPGLPTNYVVVDGAQGIYDATSHLLEQGFSNIAFVTTDSAQTQMQDRLAGYQRAVQEHQLPQTVKHVAVSKDREAVLADLMAFIDEHRQCDALIFSTNYLSIYGLEAISRLGLRIPDDLAVISYDDHDLFRLYTPAITVIAQPVESIAKNVIDILLAELTQCASPAPRALQQVVLPPTLVVRQSSVRRAAAQGKKVRKQEAAG